MSMEDDLKSSRIIPIQRVTDTDHQSDQFRFINISVDMDKQRDGHAEGDGDAEDDDDDEDVIHVIQHVRQDDPATAWSESNQRSRQEREFGYYDGLHRSEGVPQNRHFDDVKVLQTVNVIEIDDDDSTSEEEVVQKTANVYSLPEDEDDLNVSHVRQTELLGVSSSNYLENPPVVKLIMDNNLSKVKDGTTLKADEEIIDDHAPIDGKPGIVKPQLYRDAQPGPPEGRLEEVLPMTAGPLGPEDLIAREKVYDWLQLSPESVESEPNANLRQEQTDPRVEMELKQFEFARQISFTQSSTSDKSAHDFKEYVRQSSRASNADQRQRKRSKKTSVTSIFSGASSFTDNPYIHLMHDTLDRRLSSMSSDDPSSKRKISEGQSAFIAMRRGDSMTTLGSVHSLHQQDDDDQEASGRDVGLQAASHQFTMELPPRARQWGIKTLQGRRPVTRPSARYSSRGGSKVFEDYQKKMQDRLKALQDEDVRGKSGQDDNDGEAGAAGQSEVNKLSKDLYTVVELDSRRSSLQGKSSNLPFVALSNIQQPFKSRSSQNLANTSSESNYKDYTSDEELSEFSRQGLGRSTVCTSEIRKERKSARKGDKIEGKTLQRSNSFRKILSKIWK